MGDSVKQILARPIHLADQVIKSAEEAASFKQECSDLKARTAKLSDLLRQAARSCSDLYDRPTRRIIHDTLQVLQKALSLAHKCRANGLLKRAFTIIPQAAFRKMLSRLDNSIGDVSWLLRVSGASGYEDAGYLGLPPIAANEPILYLIWEQIAILSNRPVDDRSDAAASLVSLARDNDRYGKLIIEEGGVGPLLKLLKEGRSVEGQENAARAIGLLGRDPESVDHMVVAGVCCKVLKDGLMKVQAVVAWAVAELVQHYPVCQEVFAQHHAVRFLAAHLAFETVEEHSRYSVALNKAGLKAGGDDHDHLLPHPQKSHPMGVDHNRSSERLHNVVTTVQAQAKANATPPNGTANGVAKSNSHSHSHGVAGSKTRERELESAETKANMKAMAARALWHLAKGNSTICRSICESRALLCFAVLLEKGEPMVQHNCAMALMEITAVAEKDADLRRSAFKPNSPACKAVVDQLLCIIEKADSDSDSVLLLPCVKAIGNLARTFKATESRMIGPLVQLLDDREVEVSMEAAIALTKFAATYNYLHLDHSKAVVACGGIKHLVQLVYFGEQLVQTPALVLLSYIAIHVPDCEELAKSEVLYILEWASKQAHLVHDESREALLMDAKSRLELYQSRLSR